MNHDFKDLWSTFNARGVEYLVVGAHALAVHGHLRATKDLDVWVRPSLENASKVIAALVELRAAARLGPGRPRRVGRGVLERFAIGLHTESGSRSEGEAPAEPCVGLGGSLALSDRPSTRAQPDHEPL
jgi:hypothetical protein